MYPTRNIYMHYENTHDFFMASKDFIHFHNFLSDMEISFQTYKNHGHFLS